jgi:hypothetical protein
MRHRFSLLSAVALLAVLAAPVRAQLLTPDRVQTALDMTDRRIEQAQMLVSGADNDRARAELNLAQSIQSEAKSAFSSGQLAFAARLTIEARGHADRAIGILRGPNPDGVTAQLERTREILDRARERVEECDNPRARALMRVALEVQTHAESAAQDGRFLAALQLTMSARERAMRALRLCNLDDNLQDSSERALQRTDELISRAQDLVTDHGGEPARQALSRANDLQARAWQEFRADRYESSLQFTQSARTFAHRAARLSGGNI